MRITFTERHLILMVITAESLQNPQNIVNAAVIKVDCPSGLSRAFFIVSAEKQQQSRSDEKVFLNLVSNDTSLFCRRIASGCFGVLDKRCPRRAPSVRSESKYALMCGESLSTTGRVREGRVLNEGFGPKRLPLPVQRACSK